MKKILIALNILIVGFALIYSVWSMIRVDELKAQVVEAQMRAEHAESAAVLSAEEATRQAAIARANTAEAERQRAEAVKQVAIAREKCK